MSGLSKKQLLPVLFTVFLDMAAFSFLIPLIGIYGRHYGASGLTLSLLGCTYSVVQFICAPIWGRLSDHFGRRPILLITIAGSVIAFLVFGLADGLMMLFVSRAVSGMFAGNISVAQAYIADRTDRETRAVGMGLIGAMIGLGFVFGPPLGGISAYYLSLHAPGYIAAALSLVNLIFAWYWLTEPEHHTARNRTSGIESVVQGLSERKISFSLKNPFIFYCTLLFFFTFAFCHMEHPFSLFIQEQFSLPTDEAGYQTGMLLMAIGVIGVIVQGGLIRRLLKVTSEFNLLMAGLIFLAIALLLIPFCTTWSALYGTGVLIGTGSALANPCLQSLISKSADESIQGTALGFAQGLSSLARALGPFSGLWLFEINRMLPFVLAAVLYLLMVLTAGIFWKPEAKLMAAEA